MSTVTLELKNLFLKSLSEDHADQDITALATVPSGSQVNERQAAQLIAKEKGIWVGSDLLHYLPEWWHEYLVLQGCSSEADELAIFTKVNLTDGQAVKPKDCLATLWGSVRAILSVERNFLNIVGYLSGIATATHDLQTILNQTSNPTATQILDTRKVLPGFRDSAKYAVAKGGGVNHRRDLSDQFLIKENHIHYVHNQISATLIKCQEYREQQKILAALIIEVQNLAELKEVYPLKPERILLDNFNNEQLKQALELRQQLQAEWGFSVAFEASGNMNAARLAQIKDLGLEFVSVGSITHSVKTLDLSLLFNPHLHS